jgi:hypothetical protein
LDSYCVDRHRHFYSLWRSSEKMWKVTGVSAEAAKKSADAAMGVELPRFILTDVVINGTSTYPRQALNGDAMTIRFKNIGRTAAIMSRELLDWKIGENLPEKFATNFARDRPASLGTFVKQGGEEYLMRTAKNGLKSIRSISENEIHRAIDGPGRLWVYGAIIYRDFLNMCLR